MVNIIEFVMFIGFIGYVFIKSIAYGIYEIKQQNNKAGGIFVICFSLFCCFLASLVLFSL